MSAIWLNKSMPPQLSPACVLLRTARLFNYGSHVRQPPKGWFLPVFYCLRCERGGRKLINQAENVIKHHVSAQGEASSPRQVSASLIRNQAQPQSTVRGTLGSESETNPKTSLAAKRFVPLVKRRLSLDSLIANRPFLNRK